MKVFVPSIVVLAVVLTYNGVQSTFGLDGILKAKICDFADMPGKFLGGEDPMCKINKLIASIELQLGLVSLDANVRLVLNTVLGTMKNSEECVKKNDVQSLLDLLVDLQANLEGVLDLNVNALLAIGAGLAANQKNICEPTCKGHKNIDSILSLIAGINAKLDLLSSGCGDSIVNILSSLSLDLDVILESTITLDGISSFLSITAGSSVDTLCTSITEISSGCPSSSSTTEEACTKPTTPTPTTPTPRPKTTPGCDED